MNTWINFKKKYKQKEVDKRKKKKKKRGEDENIYMKGSDISIGIYL